jgi:hypothetical protein
MQTNRQGVVIVQGGQVGFATQYAHRQYAEVLRQVFFVAQ